MSETISQDGVEISLSASEFRQISQLAFERFGLDLKSGKEALVAARLGKRLRQRGFQSFAEYYRHVLADATGDALIELIDSLTTNHTSFLRERAHFEFLVNTAATEFRRAGVLQIWSAACSTGEEPYSIAMCLVDNLKKNGSQGRREFRVLATDISTRVLAHAQRGIYAAERFRELPEAWQRAFLLRGHGECHGLYKVKPEIARLVEFERINLIEPFSSGRRFHVIFCRNAMMYFNKATQQDVVKRLTACLEPGGYLLVGHSETLTGMEHGLRYVRPAVYQKPNTSGGLQVWT